MWESVPSHLLSEAGVGVAFPVSVHVCFDNTLNNAFTRFTELYVEEPADRSDLRILVQTYLSGRVVKTTIVEGIIKLVSILYVISFVSHMIVISFSHLGSTKK